MQRGVAFGGGSKDVVSGHYHQLAVWNSDWVMSNVEFDLPGKTQSPEFVGTYVVCPECGNECAMRDHAAEKICRHLDAMQCPATLTARMPRFSCNRLGV